jgi:hypothetical protein
MSGSKIVAAMEVLAALVFVGMLGLAPQAAFGTETEPQLAEDVPGDKSLLGPEAKAAAKQPDTGDHSPKSPIRLKTIDYQDAAHKLKLAGTALPGSPLYLFFDDAPLARVDADSEGNWTLEQDVELGGGKHTLRAEQYDPATRMLAGRAMITIERADSSDAGKASPLEGAMPKATTP